MTMSARTGRTLTAALFALALSRGCCFAPAVKHAGGTVTTSPPALRGTGRATPAAAGFCSAATAWAALVGGVAVAAVAKRSFTPSRSEAPGRARTAVVAMRASKADAIEEAAAKLSKAAYPFMLQVDWFDPVFNLPPGKADPIGWTKAIGTIIDHGASMDAELVKAGCEAHHVAIRNLPPSRNGVCSEAQLTRINASIGRMIASVPESKTMDVYNAVEALVDKKVPEHLMGKVSEAHAKAAYDALIEFTQVVKANPITPSTPASTVSSSAAASIDEAAIKLGTVAYPFVKGVNWTDDFYGKPVPGRSAMDTLKACDKMIVMGARMDWAVLKEAAMAHVKAIENMDKKGVPTQEDFIAMNAGIGKAIASVSERTVMDVYTEVCKLIGRDSEVPKYLYSKQKKPDDPLAAYLALMNFKDTVRAAQPDSLRLGAESVPLLALLFAVLVFLPH